MTRIAVAEFGNLGHEVDARLAELLIQELRKCGEVLLRRRLRALAAAEVPLHPRQQQLHLDQPLARTDCIRHVVERALLGALCIRIHPVALAVEMAAAAHNALGARSRRGGCGRRRGLTITVAGHRASCRARAATTATATTATSCGDARPFRRGPVREAEPCAGYFSLSRAVVAPTHSADLLQPLLF